MAVDRTIVGRSAARRLGLALSVVSLTIIVAACSSGSDHGPKPSSSLPLPSADASTIDVEMQDYAFAAPDVTVAVGTTVRWTNRGDAPHSATADDGSFDTGQLTTGTSATRTFDTPGTYAYVCSLHSSMRGTVTVTGTGTPTSSPAPSAEATMSPAPTASSATGPGRFQVPLTIATDHQVSATIHDRSGLVVAASSGTPGDGASVAPDVVALTQVDPQTIDVTWTGGPCDQEVVIAIDPETATITVVQAPCAGDAIAFDRIVRLTFGGPVDAADYQGVLQPGGDTPG